MAEKHSTKLKNILLDTAPLKTAFSTPELRIYSGTVPATADAAGGTVIATCKEGGGGLTWATSASGGTLSKSGNAWTDASGTNAGGVASYYRLVNNADDNSSDTGVIYPRIQGTIGVGAGFDMVVGSTTIAANGAFTVNYFTQSILP